ncbi:hypothetical protein [Polynucleobacter sp. 39-46-10]|uniref:hypothetical protein n=1 Tax=Polynucleobacter sp. 39-46-10 TaxID=1970428 RepID=UPI0025E50D70|nr:hypothetical protein [Polynucleobacter sp. 39-46-10]
MEYVNKSPIGLYIDTIRVCGNSLFSVYSRWSSISHMALAVGSRESRSKAVKTPLAVPKTATASVSSAVNSARRARFLRMKP